ncbi:MULTISPECIES: hypothetical protein [Methylosinus]|uniref:DUF2946 domain-containing protein n=1 Tax=Methylosinus sporium TaxID=428 RepID=A0A2U1SRK9_METSR|nr:MULTISPECIES: hypothetical protein [Methylosinus]PWB94257.1 hypothetical protein C5689_09090 [Methylosinus sporium]TRL31997.1 hypothetical protein FM996_13085 [Methylosinus sporium]
MQVSFTMADRLRSLFFRRLALGLYTLTIIVGALGFASHRGHGGAGVGVFQDRAAFCQDFQKAHSAPQTPFVVCCDACVASAPPTLPAMITHIVYRFEISTRFDFASRLGRDLDESPDNLRSRAPPAFV